jgi:plasmid stabilization system protein ParE
LNHFTEIYVMHVQNAPARAALVRAIRTHVAALRKNKYGKRILSKIHQTNTEY